MLCYPEMFVSSLGGFWRSECGPRHRFWNHLPVGPLNSVTGCQTHKALLVPILSVPKWSGIFCLFWFGFFSLSVTFSGNPEGPIWSLSGRAEGGRSLRGHLGLEAAPWPPALPSAAALQMAGEGFDDGTYVSVSVGVCSPTIADFRAVFTLACLEMGVVYEHFCVRAGCDSALLESGGWK